MRTGPARRADVVHRTASSDLDPRRISLGTTEAASLLSLPGTGRRLVTLLAAVSSPRTTICPFQLDPGINTDLRSATLPALRGSCGAAASAVSYRRLITTLGAYDADDSRSGHYLPVCASCPPSAKRSLFQAWDRVRSRLTLSVFDDVSTSDEFLNKH